MRKKAALWDILPKEQTTQNIALDQPIEMSKEQIQAFQSIFPDNHRPVQLVNSREVHEVIQK